MAHSEGASNEKALAQARKIFSTLAQEDAMRIFVLAANGIETSKNQVNGLSKKRFRAHLGELVETGLVAKEKGSYKHTPLGSLIYESQVISMERILEKSQSLEILGELRMNNRSDGLLRDAVIDLSKHLVSGVETSIGLSNLKPVKLAINRNGFLAQASAIAERAKSEICIGARALDSKLVRIAMRAAEAGCSVEIIHNRIREFSAQENTRKHDEFLNLLSALRAHSNVRLRRGTISYSFLVADRLSVAMEITLPWEQECFLMGVTFQNSEVALALASYYKEVPRRIRIDATSLPGGLVL